MLLEVSAFSQKLECSDIRFVSDDGDVHSAFSVYDTSPESPDGEYLSFVTYANPDGTSSSKYLYSYIKYVEIKANKQLLLPVSVVSSSYIAGNFPENTLKNDNKVWSVDARGQWIQYDLGGNTDVSEVSVKWGGDSGRKYYFSIAISTTTESFDSVYSGQSAGDQNVLEDYSFPEKKCRYIRIYVNGWNVPPGNLWICKRDLSEKRILSPVDFRSHDAAHAVWGTNTRIAYYYDPFYRIQVRDIVSNELAVDSIWGELGDNAHEGKLLFVVNQDQQETFLSKGEKIVEQGIYEMDLNTGKYRLICTKKKIWDWLYSQVGYTIPVDNDIWHARISPNGDKICFRWDDAAGNAHMATIDYDATNLTDFSNYAPLHFLWYDNNMIMGADRRVDDGLNDDRSVRLYTLDGKLIKTLCGPLTHFSLSPDKTWFAGEVNDYNSDKIAFALYEINQTAPYITLWEHPHKEIVWKHTNHVNPSFSRLGDRVYFSYADAVGDKILSKACYIELLNHSTTSVQKKIDASCFYGAKECRLSIFSVFGKLLHYETDLSRCIELVLSSEGNTNFMDNILFYRLEIKKIDNSNNTFFTKQIHF